MGNLERRKASQHLHEQRDAVLIWQSHYCVPQDFEALVILSRSDLQVRRLSASACAIDEFRPLLIDAHMLTDRRGKQPDPDSRRVFRRTGLTARR